MNPNITQHTSSNHKIRTQKKKGTKSRYENNPQTVIKMTVKTYISKVTLDVNGPNDPIKRYKVVEWIQKYLYTCCLQESHFRSKNIHRLRVRGWKRIFHANRNQKKAG